MSTNNETSEPQALEAGVEVKRCTKCGRILPLTEFSKSSNSKDGYATHCKECHKSYAHKEVTQAKVRATTPSGRRLLSQFLVPTKPALPEELADKTLSECTPRELMSVLKLWGYDGELTWTQKISLSNI